MTTVSRYLAKLNEAVTQLEDRVLDGIAESLYQNANHVWVMGNGGSHANASHLVLHLVDNGIAAHDLMGQGPLYSARSNDASYEDAASIILEQVAKAGDTLVVISGSGNSPNILSALKQADNLNMWKLGLLGFGGGEASALCHVAAIINSNEYGPVEDAHGVCVHLLAAKIESLRS
jgi:D-sedoheptulose 7-phosphate isomerase